MNLKFEWDKSNPKKNYAKHGVSFDVAAGVFKDTFGLELLDNRQGYGEERFVVIGMVEGHVLCVAYT